MTTPQPAIFDVRPRFHEHLEFDLRPGATDADIREAFRAMRAALRLIQPVVGVGTALMRRLASEQTPENLHDLVPIVGSAGSMPAVAHDLWIWLQERGPDVVLDEARQVIAAAAPAFTLAQDQTAFVYRDGRDLTGFVDGTENPAPDEAEQAAVVASGRGAGGSFALVQRWRHQLGAFERLTIHDQEQVIGRTKADSVELEDKPETAHISRVMVVEHGTELPIWRRSAPWGSGSAHGLQFVAFSADPRRFTLMLTRMFGATEDGIADRMLEFSRPETGAVYFCPGAELLGQWTTPELAPRA